jgi:hypothetical protein
VAWRILRLDDNGNRFVVAECVSEDEARRVADEFTARGHKQAYWVERGQVPALAEVHEVGGGEEEFQARALHSEIPIVQPVIRGS